MFKKPYFTKEELVELQNEIDNGWINVNKHPVFDYHIYNYSKSTQYDWHWNKYTIQCRGLILDGNGCLVAKGFDKFFTDSQLKDAGLEHTIPVNEPFEITDKVDGCCDENTMITTPNGQFTIKELCDMKYSGEVLSYNIISDTVEWDTVVGSNIMSVCDDWYELLFDDGNTIRLTGNHRVWLPELNCYRRVDDLVGNEYLLKR